MATRVKANNTTALNLTGSWVGGVVPTSADIAQWNSTVTGANTVALGANLLFLGVSITNPGGAVSIGTTTAQLQLYSSGIDMSAATQNLSINSPITILLRANQSWNVVSGRTLTIGANVSSTGVERPALTLSGAGIKTLTNNNAFIGSVVISAGVVRVGSSTALGNTNISFGPINLVTMTGGQLSSNSTTSYTLAYPFALSGTVTLGDGLNTGILNFNGAVTSSANVSQILAFPYLTALTLTVGTFSLNTGAANGFSTTTTGTKTINTGAALSADNTATNTNAHNIGALVLAGGTLTSINGAGGAANDGGFGNWILNGALTVTANSLISSSSFAIKASNIINISSGTTLTISSAFADSGTDVTNVVKSAGTGTLTLSGANIFTGTVSVTAGTLNATTSTTALGSTSGGAISVSSLATLSLGAAPTYSNRSLTVSGTGSSSAPNNGALIIANTGTNTFQSILLGSPTNYIRATSSGQIDAPFTSNNNSVIFGASAGTNFIPFASLSNVFSGLGSVTYGGHSLDTGIVRADVRHIYTGNTTLAFGTTYVNSSLELPGTGGPLGNKSLTAANTLLMTGGTLSYLGGSVDYSGRFSTAGSQQWKIDVAGQTVTYATALVGASSLSLNDTAANGSLTLSSASSTFSGGVTITSGTLYAGAAQNGVSGPLGITGTIAFGAVGTGTLAYTAASSSFDYSSRFATSSGQNRRINANGESVTFSTAMGGDNALLLVGSAGTLTLAVANTYTQGTTISVGTLKAGNTTALGTGAVTISASGATLQTLTAGQLNQNGKLTVASLNNAAGGIIKIGG